MAKANFIIKIDPNLDAYVLWNTERDAPDYGGTREELIEFAKRTGIDQELDARFARADATGSSAKSWKDEAGADRPGFFAWVEPGSDVFIAEQRGVVERKDLLELWRCVAVGRPYPDILKPFDDGHMVGWDSESAQA